MRVGHLWIFFGPSAFRRPPMYDTDGIDFIEREVSNNTVSTGFHEPLIFPFHPIPSDVHLCVRSKGAAPFFPPLLYLSPSPSPPPVPFSSYLLLSVTCFLSFSRCVVPVPFPFCFLPSLFPLPV